jgi:hypothetical protein
MLCLRKRAGKLLAASALRACSLWRRARAASFGLTAEGTARAGLCVAAVA